MKYILLRDAGHRSIGGEKARQWFGRGSSPSATTGNPQCDTFVVLQSSSCRQEEALALREHTQAVGK